VTWHVRKCDHWSPLTVFTGQEIMVIWVLTFFGAFGSRACLLLLGLLCISLLALGKLLWFLGVACTSV
jgi:hypothetical protein